MRPVRIYPDVHALLPFVGPRRDIGAYYRRQRVRLGEAQAIVATAHKIARTVYHLLKHREAFMAESAADYDARLQQRELAQLKRKAAKLGLSLVPAISATT